MNIEQQFGYDFQNTVANWLEEFEKCFVIRKGKIPDIITKVGDWWFWIECKTKSPHFKDVFNVDTFCFGTNDFGAESIKYQIVREVAAKNKKYKNDKTLFVLIFSDNIGFIDGNSEVLPKFLKKKLIWKYGEEDIIICDFENFQKMVGRILNGENIEEQII